MPAAFFDVDGTLIRGHLMAHMVPLFFRWREMKLRHIPVFAARGIRYKLGRYRPQDLERTWEEGLRYVRGRPAAEYAALMARAFAAVADRAVRPGVTERVAHHRDRGHGIYLATSQMHEAVAPLAKFLEADGVVATRLERNGDVLTGRLDGGPCYAQAKAERVEALCAERGLDLSDCWFYTDGIEDMPLLERVGHPVVVHPDRRLARLATERGWPVETLE